MLPAAVSHSTHVFLKLLSSGKDFFTQRESLIQIIATGLQSCFYLFLLYLHGAQKICNGINFCLKQIIDGRVTRALNAH